MSFLEKIKEKLPFSMGKEASEATGNESQLATLQGVKTPESEISESEGKKSGFGTFLSKLKFWEKKGAEGSEAGAGKGVAKADTGKEAKAEKKEDFTPVIESAIETEEKPEEKMFFEAAPEIDESLLEDVEPPKSVLLYALKGLFMLFAAVGVLSFLFFSTQLGSFLSFATVPLNIPSVYKDLTDTNKEVKDLKTTLNTYHLLEGKFYLDQFSADGDKFLRNYYISTNKSVAEADRTTADKVMEDLKASLKKSFLGARDRLFTDLHLTLVDPDVLDENQYLVIFEDLLKDVFGSKLLELESKEDQEAKNDYKMYKQAKKLIGNADLKALLRDTDLEKLTNKEIAGLIVKVNGLVENELSSMQKIKDKRIDWSLIINQIKTETTYVDQYFNEGYFEQVGGIQYTSYDFDTSTGKISITGNTKRYDTNNFTMISNLIDQLNTSSFFKNVEMKSFTKSGSPKEGYTATLKLNLELQKDEATAADKPAQVDTVPDILNDQTGVSTKGDTTKDQNTP